MCLTPNLVSALKVYIQSKLLQHAPFVVGASSGRDQTFCPRTEEREGKNSVLATTFALEKHHRNNEN